MTLKNHGQIASYGLVKHVDSVYGEIRSGRHAGGWFKSPIPPPPKPMSREERRRLLLAIELILDADVDG